MGSTAATVKGWAQSGWSETWNDCVVETQAISSDVPLRQTNVLRNNARMMMDAEIDKNVGCPFGHN